MRSLALVYSAALVAFTRSDAYQFGFSSTPRTASGKADIAKTELVKEWKFDVRIHLGQDPQQADADGQKRDTHFILLNGLQLQLCPEALPDKASAVPMPDANSIRHRVGVCTSGNRQVQVTREPFFIGMNGMETVQLERGAWEIIGREDWYPGSLICGFDLPKGIKRNAETKFPAGSIYFCFPIFTREDLEERQSKKREVQAECDKFESIKLEKLAEMQRTSNPFQKMVLYREAAQAYEGVMYSGMDSYRHIPSAMEDVIEIQEGIMVGRKGTIWTKGVDLFQNLKFQDVVGQAHIVGGPQATEDLSEPHSERDLSKLHP